MKATIENVRETTRVNASVEDLWREMGDFGDVARWHPMLSVVNVEGSGPGARRTAVGKDGSRQRERLVAFDDADHSYQYVIEESPMPVSDYAAELRVEADGDASRVTWSAHFGVTADVRKTVDRVELFFRAGLDALTAAHRAKEDI